MGSDGPYAPVQKRYARKVLAYARDETGYAPADLAFAPNHYSYARPPQIQQTKKAARKLLFRFDWCLIDDPAVKTGRILSIFMVK